MFKKILLSLLLLTTLSFAFDARLYKYPDAKENYIKATEGKDQDAAFDLALFYAKDLKDRDNAIKWYKKAYKYGSSSAATNLGNIYEDVKNYEEAVKWYKKAVERDDIVSPRNLGLIYENIYKDYSQAIFWYEKAYSVGDFGGANNIGYLYNTRLKDEEKAIVWYKKAAKEGSPEAINNLGKLYHAKEDNITSSAYVLAMANYGFSKKQILDFLKNKRNIDRKTLEKAYKLQQTLDIPKHYTGGID